MEPREKMPFTQDTLFALFPFLNSFQAAMFLQTCKKINFLFNGYLKRLVVNAKTQTKNWSILCLHPDLEQHLSQCISFGLMDFLPQLDFLLEKKIFFCEGQGIIKQVYIHISNNDKSESRKPFAISSFWFSWQTKKEKLWHYKESQNLSIPGREIKTEWKNDQKSEIISRLATVIQHFGAIVDFGLVVSTDFDATPNEENGDKVSLIEEELVLGTFYDSEWFRINYHGEESNLYSLVRPFSVPPRVGSLLLPWRDWY